MHAQSLPNPVPTVELIEKSADGEHSHGHDHSHNHDHGNNHGTSETEHGDNHSDDVKHSAATTSEIRATRLAAGAWDSALWAHSPALLHW